MVFGSLITVHYNRKAEDGQLRDRVVREVPQSDWNGKVSFTRKAQRGRTATKIWNISRKGAKAAKLGN